MQITKLQCGLRLALLALVLLSVSILQWQVRPALSQTVSRKKLIVVIDPGHGGYDPGKIGITGEIEKDLNLQIALLTKKFLEANDCIVYLTRTEDISLKDANASNQKVSDLKNRLQLILDTKADIFISIHQNSFTSPKEHGAQVFYQEGSKEGELLATILQDTLVRELDSSNRRVCKSSDNYYLLTHASCTALIIECGFLSNPKEALLLKDPTYQKKLAYAISLGVRSWWLTEQNTNPQ